MTTTQNQIIDPVPKHSVGGQASAAAEAQPPTEATEGRSVPVGTIVLFLIGCVLLVVAAMNLSNLGRWAAEHGEVLVFLGFFLVMSLGGRWFWGGVDAIIAAVRTKGED